MDNEGFVLGNLSIEKLEKESEKDNTSKKLDNTPQRVESLSDGALTSSSSETNREKESKKSIIDKIQKALFANNKLKIYKYLSKGNVVELITKKNQNGQSLLHIAAAVGDADILRLLLALIENEGVDIRENEGKTPFFKAVQCNNLSCVKDLFSAGANAKTRDFKGDSPLDHIIKNYNGKYLECMKFLMEDCNIPVNDKNDEGYAPLHLAAMHGHTKVIKYLIDNKAIVLIQDLDGNTPYDLAEKYEHAKSADELRYHQSYYPESKHDENNNLMTLQSPLEEIEEVYSELQQRKDDLTEKAKRIAANCEFLEEQIQDKEMSLATCDKKDKIEPRFNLSLLIPRRAKHQHNKQLNDRERREEKEKVADKIKQMSSHCDNVTQRIQELEREIEKSQKEIETIKEKANNSPQKFEEKKKWICENEKLSKQKIELEREQTQFEMVLKKLQRKVFKFSEDADKEYRRLENILQCAKNDITNLSQDIDTKTRNIEKLKSELKNMKTEAKENLTIEDALKKQYFKMKKEQSVNRD